MAIVIGRTTSNAGDPLLFFSLFGPVSIGSFWTLLRMGKARRALAVLSLREELALTRLTAEAFLKTALWKRFSSLMFLVHCNSAVMYIVAVVGLAIRESLEMYILILTATPILYLPYQVGTHYAARLTLSSQLRSECRPDRQFQRTVTRLQTALLLVFPGITGILLQVLLLVPGLLGLPFAAALPGTGAYMLYKHAIKDDSLLNRVYLHFE